ncbi:MAG: lysophospholipid acyltransferase family protein [Fusobacterium sp.]|nr:lysophospholipid acyltransferase family protein [Fusobacterium sp.]
MKNNKNYRFYGLLLYYFLKILTATLRIKIINKNNIDTKQAYIYGFWHSKLIAPTVFFKNYEKKVALASPSKDGELISVPLEKLGYTLVRGSSDKKAISSTISLLKYLKKGYSMGTPLDGPKGPREKTKKGLLYLSMKTQISLISLGVAYEKKWILSKTWDKFEIPKPFSRVNIVIGEAINIGKENEEDNLEEISKLVEDKVNEANDLANNFN